MPVRMAITSVELLLKEHADIDMQTQYRWTVLMIASQNGHYQVVERFLKKHANVNIQTQDGYTSLMLASECGHYQIVKLLLLIGRVNPNIKSNNGYLAVSLAKSVGHKDIYDLLMEYTDSNLLKSRLTKIKDKFIDSVTKPFNSFKYRVKVQTMESSLSDRQQVLSLTTKLSTSTSRSTRQVIPVQLPKLLQKQRLFSTGNIHTATSPTTPQ